MLNLKELAEVQVAEEKLKTEGRLKPAICTCGHPIAKHVSDESNEWYGYCKALRDHCGCMSPEAAIRVPNARFYMFGTKTGVGHAIMRGIARTVEATGIDSIEFVLPVECAFFVGDGERCGSKNDVRMVREVVNKEPVVAKNGYVCKPHRMEM